MQKNIDSETLRFSELVHSYIMFINEMMMAITIIMFLFFFNFQITSILTFIFLLIFIILYLALETSSNLGVLKDKTHLKIITTQFYNHLIIYGNKTAR